LANFAASRPAEAFQAVDEEVAAPPNNALQLTPSSLFQSELGGILAANVSAPALAVSAFWCR